MKPKNVNARNQDEAHLPFAPEQGIRMKVIHALGPVMMACCLATPSLAAVIPVPNGSFETLYQPGSTSITADTGGGWTHGVGPNADMEGDVATYSDTTTGTTVDIPGWVNATGWLPSYDWPTGSGVVARQFGGQDGLYYYAANGSEWGNPNGGAVESDANLATVVSGETYALSVYATTGLSDKVLDLLADGVALTPDAASDTIAGDWTKTTKTYSAASLGSHVGKSLKIRVGWAAGAVGTQAKLDNVELASSVVTDTDPPTLISIVDNISGGPAFKDQSVTYTVTFSETMKASSLDAGVFENASATTMNIDSVVPTADPAVIEVKVTPTQTGTLQLQVKAAVTLEDLAGNDLDTNAAIPDKTIIVVNLPPQGIVWNVNIGSQITTGDNFTAAAPENTANSFWNSVTTPAPTGLALDDSTGASGTVMLTFGGGCEQLGHQRHHRTGNLRHMAQA